jgi:release factor glutamine methyltransferase
MYFSSLFIISANVLKAQGIITFVPMKIASNKIKDIVRFFNEELNGIYDPEELAAMIRYCFEEFSGLKGAMLNDRNETTVSESELLKYNFAVKDLKKEKPLQYIFGRADFYGLKFSVNEHVLIPRPETEELVHTIIQDSKGRKDLRILDVGTGSGCIPVTLKKHLPGAELYGIDISEKALELAKENAKNNNVSVSFIREDVLSPFSFLRSPLKPEFDIIVSNPPYICESEKESMKKNVLEYEPHLALFVESDDALLFYRKIADMALKLLLPEGKIYFEINAAFGPELEQLLVLKGFKNVTLIKDMSNKNRILRGTL